MNAPIPSIRPDLPPQRVARKRPEPLPPEAADVSGNLFGDLVTSVRRSAGRLVVWVAACLAVAVVYLATTPPEFVASAQIALQPQLRLPPGAAAGGAAVAAAAATSVTLDSAQAESQLEVIRSSRNLRYVFDTLKLQSDPAFAEEGSGLVGAFLGFLTFNRSSGSDADSAARAREIAYQRFRDRVTTRRLGQSYVLELAFRAPNPRDAARVANSIAAAYIRDQVLFRAAADRQTSEFLQGRISLIEAQKQAANQAVATGVIPDFQFPDSDARIVGEALEPLAKSYPQTKLILLLAALLGLVTGVGAIVTLDTFDRTVRSADQIRRVLGVDCLAVVPRLADDQPTPPDVSAVKTPETEFARSLRLLRTVLFGPGDDAHHVSVGVASCQPGDGRTTLAINLASLLATSNDRVVLVDADLQNPDLTRRLAPKAEAGLCDLVLARSTTAASPRIALSPSLGFVVAAAEGRPADANAFLGATAIRSALTEMADDGDVVVDLPALSVSSDTLAVGSFLSGVVLVAAVNRTKLNHLSEAIRALRNADTRVLGIVLNDPLAPRKLGS